MPPADPWYGGEPLSYYYGGYLFVALFTHLCGTMPATAFNLGIAMTAGMTALGAFGVGANVLLATHGRRWRQLPDQGLRRAAMAGGASVVLLLVLGNMEGALELGAAHRWGSVAFYRRLGIEGLPSPTPSQAWYPDAFLSWWHATRLGSQFNVLEFPFFSFMLGDLHAHVLVLPVSLLGLATLLHLVRRGKRLDITTARQTPLEILFLGALAGMLGLTNSWDQPLFIGLLFAIAWVLNRQHEGRTFRALGHAMAYVAPVGVLSVVLYLPFVLHLHPATYGLSPVEITDQSLGVPHESMVFPPHHFVLFWGPLLLVGGAGIVGAAIQRRVWRMGSRAWALAQLLALFPLLLWGVAIVGRRRDLAAPLREIDARASAWSLGSYWLVQLLVVALITVGLLVLVQEASRSHQSHRAGRVYVTLTLTAALALIHTVELFYVQEPGPGRLNTLFKFSFLAWLLLATAGGAVLMDVLLHAPPAGCRQLLRTGWLAVTTVALGLGLVYPVVMPFNFTDGFMHGPTLDGLDRLRQTDPDEYAAIMWMKMALPGRPRILEAVGGDYSQYGRVSARTGFPTLLGWPFHEAQGRGGKNLLEAGRDRIAAVLRIGDRPLSGAQRYERQAALGQARARDIEFMYRTTSADQARELLRRYGVHYVYIGQLEREAYGSEGLDKFEQVGHVVYRRGTVVIYELTSSSVPALGSYP